MFEDEISLALSSTVSYKWSERGQQPNIKVIQKRKKRQTIFGSVNYESGQLTITRSDKGNSISFRTHLKKILKVYKEQPGKIIIVLDNVRYHHARALKPFLEFHKDRMELVFLPAYSPDLNPIERVWWYMRKNVTHGKYFDTFEERIKHFWKFMSQFLKPNDKIKDVCVVSY